ncbi:hypothetical protein CXB51_008288 [Gossypium anomalum]|uniref:Transposase n=1 Tax=Gossypium anomalum TaxID=47600 RepID=A0A8J6D621_9ROSI|nr:hypothetical protein CXB51_008288 [Gossypium anomalum]
MDQRSTFKACTQAPLAFTWMPHYRKIGLQQRFLKRRKNCKTQSNSGSISGAFGKTPLQTRALAAFLAFCQSDGRWRFSSNNPESSAFAAGIALETLAGVVSLASPELDQSLEFHYHSFIISSDCEGKMPRRRLRDLSIVQNTNSEEVTENGGTRRGRGRTLLTDLYKLNSADRVKVTRNSHGQRVGQEARLLAGYLGIIARNANMFPINYESWHNMPDSNKNQALSNIKERFALEVSDAYIKKALGKKWRDNKSILKKEYFKKPIILEEKLQNVPPGMLRYQWEDAIRFWNSKKGEDRERVGTSSRQKQKFTHTAGSRSFACVAQAALFDITYRKKDGTPMTSEAAEIMEKLKDKKAEYEATASTDSSVNFEDIDNRIINEVLGPERYGRVRFQGSGVNPTQYFGSTSHQYMPFGSQSQAEVQRLKDQIVQIQASTDEQISQLRAKAAAREAEQNRKYNELQLQLQSMMTMFQQFQNPPS